MTFADVLAHKNKRSKPSTQHIGVVLDLRVRLLIVLVTSVSVIMLSRPLSLGIFCLFGALYLTLSKRYKVQLISYIFLAAMSGMSVLFVYILGYSMPIMMPNTGAAQMLVPLLRMTALFHAVMGLALSLNLQHTLGLMKSLHMPRVIYLPLAVAIRFLPGMLNDILQLRDCLRLRGYRGLQMLTPRLWLLPMVFRCLCLSDELAISAELKGIGYGRIAKSDPPIFWTRNTIFALTVLTVVLSVSVWTNHQQPPSSHHHSTTSNHSTHLSNEKDSPPSGEAHD